MKVLLQIGAMLWAGQILAAEWTAKDSELLFSLSDPPKAKALKCPKHWNNSWCDFATRYASMYLPQVRRSSKTPTISKPPVAFVAKKAQELQSEGFNRTYNILLSNRYKKIKTLEPFAKAALTTTGCPRYLSLALAHRWEVELPSEQAKEQISKLYSHALACNDYSDMFRVRAGLLEYHFGNKSKALDFLDSALKAPEQREGFRALYWATRIAKELGKKQESSKYEAMLFDRFPLSYYTIRIKEEKNINTLSGFSTKISSRPNLQKNDPDKMEYLFKEVLKHPKATQKETRLIAYLASKQTHLIEESNLKKLADLLDQKGLYRAKILLLNLQLSSTSNGLTLDWVKEMFPIPYFESIKKHSTKVHPFVVMGFMRQESGFDPLIVSPAGAAGLMQLMPATAKWIHGKRKPMPSLFNTDFNISLGAKYISKNFDRFDGSFVKAASAYNGGIGFIRRWEKRYPIKNEQLWADLIPFTETRNYVPSVKVNAYWYQKLYSDLVKERVPASGSELFEFTEAARKASPN